MFEWLPWPSCSYLNKHISCFQQGDNPNVCITLTLFGPKSLLRHNTTCHLVCYNFKQKQVRNTSGYCLVSSVKHTDQKSITEVGLKLFYNITLRYISFSWRFYPKRLTISAFNHEGTDPEQQESRKYNFFKKAKLQSAIGRCHLSATKLLVYTFIQGIVGRGVFLVCSGRCVNFLLSWCQGGITCRFQWVSKWVNVSNED